MTRSFFFILLNPSNTNHLFDCSLSLKHTRTYQDWATSQWPNRSWEDTVELDIWWQSLPFSTVESEQKSQHHVTHLSIAFFFVLSSLIFWDDNWNANICHISNSNQTAGEWWNVSKKLARKNFVFWIWCWMKMSVCEFIDDEMQKELQTFSLWWFRATDRHQLLRRCFFRN